MTLFREQGYAATGLSEILTLSGAPKGSLYHHFPEGKAGLAAAAVSSAGAVVRETLERLEGEAAGPDDFFERYGQLLEIWMAGSGFRSGCPIATVLLETCPRSEQIRLAGQRALAGWTEVIARVLMRQGHAEAAARQGAGFAIAAIEGALLLARVQRSTAPIRQATAALGFLFSSPGANR